MSPQIVGVIFSRADFRRALRMRRPPDLFELRLDRLTNCLDEVRACQGDLPAPFIATARSPGEGGANNLPARKRRALLLGALPCAAWVDVEFECATVLDSVLRTATANKAGKILSFHDFKTTPEGSHLDDIVSGAMSLGADLVKIATRTDTLAELETLFEFFDRHRRSARVAAMGIGRLGRASRLELARLGCPLNYAHLGTAAVPGQLSIRELRHAIG